MIDLTPAVIAYLREKGMSDTDILDLASIGYVAPISTVTRDEQAARRAARNARYYEARKERLNKTAEASELDVKGSVPLGPPALSPTPPNSPPYNPPTSKLSVQRQRRTPSEFFDRFWSAYPKREGANPRKPALDSFNRRVAAGADPEAIIRGAQHYAHQQSGKDARFVAQAVTWLNQERWNDHIAVAGKDPPPPEAVPRFETEEEFQAWWNQRMGVVA